METKNIEIRGSAPDSAVWDFIGKLEKVPSTPFTKPLDCENGGFFACEGSKVVGCGTIRFSNKPTRKYTAELAIAIDPDYRKRGVASWLMRKMIEYSKHNSARKIWLRVYTNNYPAIALYKKFGFVVEGIFMKQEWLDDKTPLHVQSMALFL